MRTLFVETHMRAHTHTYTHTLQKAASIRAQQFLSSPISLVSTVTADWAEEFWDAPLQSCRRMNGLSVPSLPDPNVSLGQGMTRGCGGMTVTAGGIWCSGYSLRSYFESRESRFGSSFQRKWCCAVRGQRAEARSSGYQLFLMIKSLPPV